MDTMRIVIYLLASIVASDTNVRLIGMIRLDPSSTQPIGSELLLWGGSFLLVVTLHVAAFVGLQGDRAEGEGAGDPAVMIELEADATAPIQADQISQASVAQQQVGEQTQKEKEVSPQKVDVARAPDPEVAMPEARE